MSSPDTTLFMGYSIDELIERANGELMQIVRRKKILNKCQKVSRSCSPIDIQRVEQALLRVRIDEGTSSSPGMKQKDISEDFSIEKYVDNLRRYHNIIRELAMRETSKFVSAAQLDE